MTEPPGNRHALAFIFITMLVDTIGLGIIIPVTQVGASEQGELQGALASLGSLTSVAAPPCCQLVRLFHERGGADLFPRSCLFRRKLFLALSALMFARSRRTPNPAEFKVGGN